MLLALLPLGAFIALGLLIAVKNALAISSSELVVSFNKAENNE